VQLRPPPLREVFLNRDLPGAFGSKTYFQEELCAEISSTAGVAEGAAVGLAAGEEAEAEESPSSLRRRLQEQARHDLDLPLLAWRKSASSTVRAVLQLSLKPGVRPAFQYV
jgi:hypothetical protein